MLYINIFEAHKYVERITIVHPQMNTKMIVHILRLKIFIHKDGGDHYDILDTLANHTAKKNKHISVNN